MDLPPVDDWGLEAHVYDQASTGRIYPCPRYDEHGQLVCRACGAVMALSMSKRGEGLAVCANTGCPAHGFEVVEGSYFSNPARR